MPSPSDPIALIDQLLRSAELLDRQEVSAIADRLRRFVPAETGLRQWNRLLNAFVASIGDGSAAGHRMRRATVLLRESRQLFEHYPAECDSFESGSRTPFLQTNSDHLTELTTAGEADDLPSGLKPEERRICLGMMGKPQKPMATWMRELGFCYPRYEDPEQVFRDVIARLSVGVLKDGSNALRIDQIPVGEAIHLQLRQHALVSIDRMAKAIGRDKKTVRNNIHLPPPFVEGIGGRPSLYIAADVEEQLSKYAERPISLIA